MKQENEIFSLVFNDIYQIDKKISEGSFGTVFLGFNRKNSQKVAIKIEKDKISMYNTLYKEAQILKKIQGIAGIPRLFYCGQKFIYKAMVLELLGLDLLQFYKRFRRFSLKTVCKIAYQLINILQKIHEKGIVHRDLKPENVAIGFEKGSNMIYLLDFGIAKEFLESGKHISYQEGRPFIGTIRFASLAAHKGIELSRKDDLESLGYLFIFFLKGKLPWQNGQKLTQTDRKKMVANMKEHLKLDELCQNLPETFNIYLKYVKNLSFKEKPNYVFLKGLFIQLAQEMKLDLEDGIWDWTESNQINPSLSLSSSKQSQITQKDENYESSYNKLNSLVFEKNLRDSVVVLGKIDEEEKSEVPIEKIDGFEISSKKTNRENNERKLQKTIENFAEEM